MDKISDCASLLPLPCQRCHLSLCRAQLGTHTSPFITSLLSSVAPEPGGVKGLPGRETWGKFIFKEEPSNKENCLGLQGGHSFPSKS